MRPGLLLGQGQGWPGPARRVGGAACPSPGSLLLPSLSEAVHLLAAPLTTFLASRHLEDFLVGDPADPSCLSAPLAPHV